MNPLFENYTYTPPKVKTRNDFIEEFYEGVNANQRKGDKYISKAYISIRMNRHPSYVPFKEKQQLWHELSSTCKADGYSMWWNKTEVI